MRSRRFSWILSVLAPMSLACASDNGDAGVGSVAWGDREYETDCGDLKLRDGRWDNPPGPGFAVDSFQVGLLDVTGDGDQDAVVSLNCSTGGNLVKANVYVFEMSGGEPHQVGQTIHETWAGSVSGQLTTSVAVFGADDPKCCPFAEDRNVWALRGGRWSVETSERVRLATETDATDPDVSPSTGEVEAIYSETKLHCRGGPGNQASTWQGCDVRQAVIADLHDRGRCLASESLWATCPTGYDTGADLDDCSPPTETQQVLIEDVSCSEALQVVEEAADVALTPTRVGRFTCVASGKAPPRTIWCGDYGADLTMQETTPGAIVWRTNE